MRKNEGQWRDRKRLDTQLTLRERQQEQDMKKAKLIAKYEKIENLRRGMKDRLTAARRGKRGLARDL